MRNTMKFLGTIALVAVIGFSMAACDDGGGDSGGSGSGGFTLTGIPSQYNGMYALFSGQIPTGTGTLMGAQSISTEMVVKAPTISNEKVTIPGWTQTQTGSIVKYSGSDTTDLLFLIYDSPPDATLEGSIASFVFTSVTFSKGSATKAWSDGTAYP